MRYRVSRGLSAGLITAVLACASLAAQAKDVTDLRGRSVTVPDAPASIAVDDGRFLLALSLISKDPVGQLAAWPHDVNRLGEVYSQHMIDAFPALEALPTVASSAESFDMESMLAVDPDVAVVSLNRGPSDAQVALLESAGIPVVFIDFFIDPFAHQAKSLELLAEITGNTQQAADYLALRDKHLARIAQGLEDADETTAPSVFMEAHAGITRDCCFSPGSGGLGDYIDFAGGHNIGADVLDKASGKLNMEYIIAAEPDVYIATGGPDLARSGGLVMGGGYTEDEAREALANMAARSGIKELAAVQEGRVHGLAHQLLNSPLDIVAVEALAKWLHPTTFADLDPAATLDQINQRFLAVPYTGTGWVSLREADAATSNNATETDDVAQ